MQFYRQTRDRIQQQFSALSGNWPDAGATGLPKRIVFYGAGEVAEIGYICLVETDLQLVGVVDAARTKPFFGLSVCSPEHLDGLALNRVIFNAAHPTTGPREPEAERQARVTVPREEIQTRLGRFSVETMQRVDRALEDSLGLARD